MYTLLVSWYVFLVVHFVGTYLGTFPGCKLGCKSTHFLFSTVISSFLGSLEATCYFDAPQMTSVMFILQFHFYDKVIILV